MELLVSSIVNPVIESLTTTDSRVGTVRTAHLELENVSFGLHKDFWGTDRDAIDPLRTITITYDLFCDRNDRESIVEQIVAAFQDKHNGWMELFSVEMTSTVTTRWYKGPAKVMTRDWIHQPKLVISYSEDPRLLHTWTTESLSKSV